MTGVRLIKIIRVRKPFAELLNETSFYSHGKNEENRTIPMQLKCKPRRTCSLRRKIIRISNCIHDAN